MDLDINKLDISQLDAILVKYKWNPNEKEIDEGTLGGKSKSDAVSKCSCNYHCALYILDCNYRKNYFYPFNPLLMSSL